MVNVKFVLVLLLVIFILFSCSGLVQEIVQYVLLLSFFFKENFVVVWNEYNVGVYGDEVQLFFNKVDNVFEGIGCFFFIGF